MSQPNKINMGSIGKDPLAVERDFNMLSLRDLIEARDLYHLHLTHLQNVVATAVGRYRIRKTDPWPTAVKPGEKAAVKTPPREVRTLENSEVRPYSWPCILVFVDKWIDLHRFGGGGTDYHPADMVPPALYLPDGRVVPVCVIEAPADDAALGAINHLGFPQNLIGGGYPVLAEVQGEERVASLGCMVSDGHSIYALTNRHVSGPAGVPLYSILGGKRVRIGTSSDKQLTRLPFQDLYADWPGKDVYVNLDIGLIEIEDKHAWTAQIFGLGEIGKMADLSINNISLRLIGCPVRAFGCASGQMAGEIQALFYRYKSVGGFEYVADFLIGPDGDTPFSTHPGDSGTIWLLKTGETGAPAMPLAIQWGGHVFLNGGKTTRAPYALATCLSTVCSLLNVDVVRGWNIGHDEYWGEVGHYAIANKACDVIHEPHLRTLMRANLDNITFDTADITAKNLRGTSNLPFIPLADVPDLVWKFPHPHNRGGSENPNHFADMDKPDGHGKTLLEICDGKPENVALKVWQDYYTSVGDKSRGLLPFRVWQFHDAMVGYARAGKTAEFVCAAGILSHYVGDACQPLHISHLFNGDPDDAVTVQVKNKKTHEMESTTQPRAAGVHAAYEDDMVDANTPAIMSGVDTILAKEGPLDGSHVKTGHDAAVAVVQLMQGTFALINPGDIVNTFKQNLGATKSKMAAALWEAHGDETIKVIAQGCRCLAMLWNSAWVQGRGSANITKLDAVEPSTLADLYQRTDFLPSCKLDTIGDLLKS